MFFLIIILLIILILFCYFCYFCKEKFSNRELSFDVKLNRGKLKKINNSDNEIDKYINNYNYLTYYEDPIYERYEKISELPKNKIKKQINNYKKIGSETGKKEENYLKKNDCSGYWDEWDTSRCNIGNNNDKLNPNNRCALKMRRYNIIKKADKNSIPPGIDCPFKDNQVQFDYCINPQMNDGLSYE